MKSISKYLLILLLFSAFLANSQVIINQKTTAVAPAWGPSDKTEVRYYYLPDIEIYYDLHKANFIYSNGSNWVYSDVLPMKYSSYDLYSGYKVLLFDYFGPKPYSNFKTHKSKYPKGYNGQPLQANPKGKIKEDGKAPTKLYNIKKKN
jgi:hypothetical protein